MSLSDTVFSEEFKPSDNFYYWVNKHWIDNNPIPNEFSRWGSFVVLSETNNERIKQIVESQYSKDSVYNKFHLLYKQGMNEERRKDISEVITFINEIRSKNNIEELMRLIVDYQMSWGIGSPVSLSVFSDFENANMNILHLFSGGLGLPDRDYYLLDSKEHERTEYKKFMKRFQDYFGLNLDLDGIFELEKILAEHTYTKVQKRQPELLNNPRTIEDINKEYNKFGFVNYFFTALNVNPDKINLGNPKYFIKVNELFNTISLNLWKDYFCFRFLQSIKSYISIEAEQICFDFYGKILSGAKEMKPLWKRVIGNVQDQFGQLIGQCYVEQFFSEKAKKDALEMIHYLKLELRNKIQNLDWMEETTKEKALYKLDKMKVKVGYPDKEHLRDYSKTHPLTEQNSYLRNNLICNLEDSLYRLSKLYKEIDRNEWFMDAYEVNAYYSPSYNEIVFPAGILQPPFFSADYDKALNFGGIGAVIGHEMTHGFDDQGSKYDGDGNLNNWWSEKDALHYKSKTENIKNQFYQYNIEGETVNGDLTLGENIADLGGVKIALDGLKRYLEENPEDNKVIDGLTPIQRFFISYARIWRSNSRPEDMKQRILTDPHSPPILRVNGILKNVSDFYNVFGIISGELFLNETNRANIW